MKYRNILTASVLLAAVSTAAIAQDYDPTVEVTKDFVSTMADANKESVKSSLPDSLTRFNLDFDYEVFSKPYKGSYQFTPYNVMFIADDEVAKRPFLYMNAGAGYGLHPEFTAVVSPRLGRRFSMDIYSDFSGYYGKYENLADRMGCDLSGIAGVRGGVRLDALDILFNADYRGMGVRDYWIDSGMYHRVDGSLRLTSSDIAQNFMTYDVTAAYSLAREFEFQSLTESAFNIYGSLAPSIQYEAFRFVLDFNTGYKGYYGTLDSAVYSIETTPYFLFNLWKFNFSAGAKFSYFDRMVNADVYNSLHVYPDLKVDIRLFRDRLDIYAGVTGGDKINSYSAFKQENHHFSMAYVQNPNDVLSCSRERLNAYAGFGGSIASVFQYDLRGGYAINEGSPLLGYDKAAGIADLVLLDYNYAFVDAQTKIETRPVDFNFAAHYRYSDIDQTKAFSLPAFTADAGIVGKIRQRIFIGADFEMSTARTMLDYTLNPFYKLGVSLEYKPSTTFPISLWVRGDNLLNQRIERIPGIVETGIGNGLWFTAGFRLDLR